MPVKSRRRERSQSRPPNFFLCTRAPGNTMPASSEREMILATCGRNRFPAFPSRNRALNECLFSQRFQRRLSWARLKIVRFIGLGFKMNPRGISWPIPKIPLCIEPMQNTNLSIILEKWKPRVLCLEFHFSKTTT